MASQIPDVRHLGQHPPGQFPLYAKAILLRVTVHDVRIDRREVAVRRKHSPGAVGIRQVAIFYLGELENGRNVELRENHIALGAVVEDAITAAEDRLFRQGYAKPKRGDQVFCGWKKPRGAPAGIWVKNGVCAARHAALLVGGDAIPARIRPL